jgi:hypothetical protein
LTNIVSLPEEARGELQRILEHFKFLVKHEGKLPPNGETKKRLTAMRGKARALLSDLRRAGRRWETLIPLTYTPAMEGAKRLDGVRAFDEHVAHVESLANWLKAAEDRIRRGKTGDKTRAPLLMTKHIDSFLFNHMKWRLTPSAKSADDGLNFLRECLSIVGSNVKATSLIKRMASERLSKVTSKNS